MERVGTTSTGRAIAYIKDGLNEINEMTETHTDYFDQSVAADTRNYAIPRFITKILDIQVKNHLNTNDEYRSIPRLVDEPTTRDEQ